MPKREPVLKSVKKLDPLTLNCEWEACHQVFDEMNSFTEHISNHLQLLFHFINEENAKSLDGSSSNDSLFACYWNECNHEPFDEFSSLTRHVYFHAFHMKIKSIGKMLIAKNNVQGCTFDSSSRNTIPDIPERFSCGWSHCSAVYDNPEVFYLHVNNHCDVYPSGNHVPGGCRCQWGGCETVVKSKHKLKDHVRAHTQEKLAACPTCGTLFSNMTRLYDHLKRQLESDGESYQCSHCNKRYATERLLKEHMRHHVSHFQCPFCDMTCPNLVNLRLHFQYRHSESRPFRCDQCPHAAKSQSDLRRHQETHKSWIQCDLDDCSFRCHSVNELKRHNKLKHEYTEGIGQHQFQCHLCSACYVFGTNLTSHLRKKHKFRWPPGHVRFRYKFHSDGYYRLQTVRYESIELTQQILASDITGGVGVETTSAVDNPQEEVTQCIDNPGPFPADVLQEVIIKNNETTKGNDVMYSYNLDLLGDVALQDSAKCQNGVGDSPVIGKLSKQNGSDSSNKTEHPAKNSKRRAGQRGKRKRGSVKGVDIVKTEVNIQPKCTRIESCPVQQSTPVQDLTHIGNNGSDCQPMTEQTISLPDGQQIIVTSNVPVNISVLPETPTSLDKAAITIEQTQAQFEGLASAEAICATGCTTSDSYAATTVTSLGTYLDIPQVFEQQSSDHIMAGGLKGVEYNGSNEEIHSNCKLSHLDRDQQCSSSAVVPEIANDLKDVLVQMDHS